MDIQKEKAELIEMYGIHFEKLYHLPPLASRILSNLIVDACSVGLTFEVLVERLDASKSSVSINLNLLLKLGKINYYTVAGDRKKYFRASPFSERFANYLKILDFEESILDRMFEYRKNSSANPDEFQNMQIVKEYKKHVTEIKELIAKNLANFIKIENKKS